MVERYGGIPPFAETQSYVKRILSQLAAALPPPPQIAIPHSRQPLDLPNFRAKNYWVRETFQLQERCEFTEGFARTAMNFAVESLHR